MRKVIFGLFFIIFASNCTNIDHLQLKTEILNTDIAFSDYSLENGFNKAFVAFAADDAVLLKPGRMPIIGILAIEEYHHNENDEELVLSWKPTFADVAESGELGYTYGFWKLSNKSDSLLSEGTYVTIWKRQKDSTWKYVLDSGNSGLE